MSDIPIYSVEDSQGNNITTAAYECAVFHNDGNPVGRVTEENVIGGQFRDNVVYFKDFCIMKDHKLYKFEENHEGAWDPDDVTETKVNQELYSLSRAVTTLNSTLAQPSTVHELTSEHQSVTITGGYTTIGKIVVINAKLVVSASIAVSTKIFSGAPNPLNSEGISYQMSTVGFTGSVRQSGTNVYLNQAINADTYWVSGCYIAN